MGWLHGIHLLDSSAAARSSVVQRTTQGRRRYVEAAVGRSVRVPEDAGGRPAVPRQCPEHSVVLGDARREDRPDGAVLRGQRHGQPDDRGERRLAGRHGASFVGRDAPPLHSQARTKTYITKKGNRANRAKNENRKGAY